MKFVKTDNTVEIKEFRKELYQRFTAPLDAMWEQLYIASSQHYLIEENKKNIGYCCINDKKSLLQIYLKDTCNSLMDKVVLSLIESKLISSASLSAIEPVSFNTCLFFSKSINANTFLYQYSKRPSEKDDFLKVEPVLKEDISLVKTFLKEQIGFDDTFGYTENLVERKEIYLLKESGLIIATTECRLSDSQAEVADLGIIVNKDYQRKGIATQVLKQQILRALEANRNPICSTTVDNVASQKAIEKAGFYRSNIIFDLSFLRR